MATLDITNIKDEILVWLRNSDIFSIGTRGVTTVTEEFNGDNVEVNFTLAQAGAKNVRTVTVGGVAVAFGSGYTVAYGTSTVVTFATAPAGGTDNVDITYDYGTTGDNIYPDFPRDDITISSFPRIGFDIMFITTEDAGFGNNSVSDIDIDIITYDDKISDVEDYIDAIRSQLITDRDGFYYLKRMIPVGTGPVIKSAMKGNKVFQKNLSIRSILNYEKN